MVGNFPEWQKLQKTLVSVSLSMCYYLIDNRHIKIGNNFTYCNRPNRYELFIVGFVCAVSVIKIDFME